MFQKVPVQFRDEAGTLDGVQLKRVEWLNLDEYSRIFLLAEIWSGMSEQSELPMRPYSYITQPRKLDYRFWPSS